MTTQLNLIHSPLVGPSTWQPTAERLRRKGFPTTVPELTTIAPPYYQTYAHSAATDTTDPVILIAHSGAGALLPTIADQTHHQEVLGAVFVDAVLPHPNQSWFDTAPPPLRDHLKTLVQDDDHLAPWNEWFPPDELIDLLPDEQTRTRFIAEIPRLPLAYFTERAPATDITFPCAYLRLSEAYDDIATQAEQRGWWVHRTDADHLAPYTQPDRIADLITQAIEHLAT